MSELTLFSTILHYSPYLRNTLVTRFFKKSSLSTDHPGGVVGHLPVLDHYPTAAAQGCSLRQWISILRRLDQFKPPPNG